MFHLTTKTPYLQQQPQQNKSNHKANTEERPSAEVRTNAGQAKRGRTHRRAAAPAAPST